VRDNLISTQRGRLVDHTQLPWKASAKNVELTASASSSEKNKSLAPVSLFSTLPKLTPLRVKESADLQPWLSDVTQKIDSSTFVATWMDGHDVAMLGTRQPDIVHYPRNTSQSKFTVLYIGDLKSQADTGSSDFNDDSVTHMFDFLFALGSLQPWRHQFIGYLLDGKSISIFVVTLNDSPTRGGQRSLVRIFDSLFTLLCTHRRDFFVLHAAPRFTVLTSTLCWNWWPDAWCWNWWPDAAPCAGIGGQMLGGLLETSISTLGGGFPSVTIMREMPLDAAPATSDFGLKSRRSNFREARSMKVASLLQSLPLDDVLGLGGISTVFRSQFLGTACAVKVLGNGDRAVGDWPSNEQPCSV
jgi:hypothetical protein